MYTAYIYSRQGDTIAVLEDLMNVQVAQKINQPGDASFVITPATPGYDMSKMIPYATCRILKLYGGQDVEILTGVLVGIQKDSDQIKVIVKSCLHLLQREKITWSIYSSTTIQAAIQASASLIASKTWYTVSVSCDVVENIINKEFRFGMNIYDVIKELAGTRYEFDFVWNEGTSYTLSFMQSIGADKTTGPWAVEYRYDISDLSDANMEYQCNIDFTELANTIYARSGSSTTIQSDPASIIAYWPLEETITPSGDVVQEATKALEEKSILKKNYELNPKYSEQDYFRLDIGDIVAVYIYENSILTDYTWVMKVLSKSLTAGDSESYKIVIGTDYLIGEDIIDVITWLKRRVTGLELS